MEKIERPKKLSRNESSYQSNDDFQANTNIQLTKIYDKLDEIIEMLKQTENNPIIRDGFKIVTATNSNGALLFTEDEIKKMFGLTSLDITKITGFVLNSDTNAWNGNCLALRVSKSNNNIYVLLDQTVTGSVGIRVNYTLFYNK